MADYLLTRFLAPNANGSDGNPLQVPQTTADKYLPNAYALAIQNLDTHAANKDAANSFTALQTFAAGATVSSGQTLTLTGATVAGTPTWASNQAITLSTAAQPNVTSLGTLTSLTTSGAITSTVGGTFFTGSGSTTGQANLQFSNTGGSAQIGIESSTGGTLQTGTSAYSTVVGAFTATALALCTNSNARVILSSAGQVQIVTAPSARQAGDVYLVIDASGNIHKSAIGPAS